MTPTTPQKKLPPPKKIPRDPNSVGTMISTIALAIGVGIIGVYARDLHSPVF